MTLISDIRGLFTRKKPVVVDLTSTQADGLSRNQKPDTNVEPKMRRSGDGDSQAIEKRPTNGRLRSGAPSNAQVEEVMSIVRNISSHLESQTRRTDKLIECMERLPNALDALPEINRQNSRLLEIVSDYLTHARQRDDALNDTLSGISNATTRHTEVLGLLQQQLDASGRSTESLASNLDGFKQALAQLAGTNTKTTTILSEMNRAGEKRDAELTRMLNRTQKWMIAAMACCAAASVTAIAVAGLVLFSG